MSDKKPTGTGQKPGTPPAKAKANGTTPTVTARRPLSKDEYARTTKESPDATAVIPAVREDQPAPPASKSADSKPVGGKPAESKSKSKPVPEVDDRPTQAMKAVPADVPGSKDGAKVAPKKESQKSAKAGAPESASAAAAAAPPAPAPATPKPELKTAPEKTEPAKPEPAKAEPAKPAAKVEPAKKAVPSPPAEQSTQTAPASTGSRSALLQLRHIEPWSVTKMAFVVAVALMIVSVVAVTVFWIVLQITGVWGALNDSISNVLADDAAAFDITEYLGFGRVVGVTLLVSSLNVVFMTALATIAAHLYNLSAGILGGIEMSFAERK